MCVLPIRGDYGGMFYGRFASNRVICGKKIARHFATLTVNSIPAHQRSVRATAHR
jgi:hypothetical protein